MLCFAATGVATLYHYLLGLAAPYDLPSLPKLLGGIGGVSLAIGTAGLWRLNLPPPPAAWRCRAKAHGPGLHRPAVPGGHQRPGAVVRRAAPPALALLLCLHLGAVMALFATLPYGKFAHGMFRTAALAAPRQPKSANPTPSAWGPIEACGATSPAALNSPHQKRTPHQEIPMQRRTLIQCARPRCSAPACPGGVPALRPGFSRPRSP